MLTIDTRGLKSRIMRATRVARAAAWLSASVLLMLAGIGQAAQTFSIKEHADFPQPAQRLRDLVAAKGKRAVNHFCIVGYRQGESESHAWVHWREGNALILWEPAADPSFPTFLAKSRRYLQLDRDVAGSEAELGGSTYRVTRAFVDEVLTECEKHGQKFEIRAPRKSEAKKPKREQ